MTAAELNVFAFFFSFLKEVFGMFSICVTGHRPDKLFGYDIHVGDYDGIRHDIKKAVYQILLAHPEEKK